MTAFGWTYAVLWLLVIIQGVGVLTLFYYQGVAITNKKSRAQDHGPPLGSRASVLRKTSLAGQDVRLGGRRQYVLFVSTNCKPCQRAVKAAAAGLHEGRLQDFTIVTRGREAEVKAFASEYQVPQDVVLPDVDGMMARTWEILSVPFLVVLDDNGVVERRGNPSSLHAFEELTVGPRRVVA